MVFNPFGENLSLVWDLLAAFISIISVMIVVLINSAIQKSGKLSPIVTRKLVHIFAGPVFVVTWFLFSGTIFSRFIAIIVPILFVLQFIAIGTGKMKNERFVASMSRTGDPKELLKGPLYYALIMVIITFFWFYIPANGLENANPAALIIIGCLSGGDGLADVIGRKFGGEKKFGIKGSEKTVAGTIGMFIGSFLFSIILIAIFSLEVSTFNLIQLIIPTLLISIVATIVEALSPKGLDNWTVFLFVTLMIFIFSTFIPMWWPFPFFSF
jgi:phytol kinase